MKLTPLACLGLAAISHAKEIHRNQTKPHEAQGKTSSDGSVRTYAGYFLAYVVSPGDTTPYSYEAQNCDNKEGDGEMNLVMNLTDGKLRDILGRIGCVVQGRQFQFDGPPQHDAISQDNFSIVANGSLAHDSSTVFYACVSGHFSNLYDRHIAPQCSVKHIIILPCGQDSNANKKSAAVPEAPASGHRSNRTSADGGGKSPAGGSGKSPAGGSGKSPAEGSGKSPAGKSPSPAEGGQPAAGAKVPSPICQIGDGQIQVHDKPCGGQPPILPPKAVQPTPIKQIGDGQIQVHSKTSPAPMVVTPAAAPKPAPPVAPKPAPSAAPKPAPPAAPKPAPPAAPKPAPTTSPKPSAAGTVKSLPAAAAALLVAAIGAVVVL